jgi:hypothetical protein
MISIARRSTSHADERSLPHIVEMRLPSTGFEHRLRLDMEEFHRSHNIQIRFGQQYRRGGTEYCRWCFDDATIASLFHARFGGERLNIASDLKRKRTHKIKPCLR